MIRYCDVQSPPGRKGDFFLPGGVLFCTGREYRFRKTDKDLGWERIEHYIDTAGLTGM